MANKGSPPTYTETCTNCGAAIPVTETLYVDGENKGALDAEGLTQSQTSSSK
jgi:hypothetical protein